MRAFYRLQLKILFLKNNSHQASFSKVCSIQPEYSSMEDALIMDTQLNDILPSKEAIATFPPFQNIAPENIVVINSIQQCEALREELEQIAVFGLDTESNRPSRSVKCPLVRI